MPRLVPRIVVALSAVLLAFLPVAAVASTPPALVQADDGTVTWSVEPAATPEGNRASFQYSVDPGTQIVDNVLVSNHGETSIDFTIYATDAINEPDTGAFSLLKADETPTDVGSWITTASDKLTLAAGQQADVPFNLLVPSDATPGDHVAGIVASVQTTGESNGATVVLDQRVGARVYLKVSGPVQSGVEVSGVTSGYTAELNPFAPGSVSVSYDVRNSGNLREGRAPKA